MKTNKVNDFIEVFSGTSIEAGIVMSMLKDAEVEAFLKDDYMGTIAPWHVSGGGAGAVKIVVSIVELEKAKVVIEDYNNNSKNTR
jgi:hypothetical protein